MLKVTLRKTKSLAPSFLVFALLLLPGSLAKAQYEQIDCFSDNFTTRVGCDSDFRDCADNCPAGAPDPCHQDCGETHGVCHGDANAEFSGCFPDEEEPILADVRAQFWQACTNVCSGFQNFCVAILPKLPKNLVKDLLDEFQAHCYADPIECMFQCEIELGENPPF